MQSHLQNSRRLALTCLLGALVHPALGLDRPPQTPQQAPAPASPKPAKSAAEIAAEQKQAETLRQAQNFIAALPLYEDLHAQQPDNNLFRERLALALLATAGGESDAAARATRKRARQLLLDAQAAGDNSNFLQVELENLQAGDPIALPNRPVSPGADALARAEKAFSSGDLPGATRLYEEAAKADPKLYEAPLFAGDAEYKQNHFAEAGAWFVRAIAIDPDRETAYRYWGDTLMKAGDPTRARAEFIDSIVAEPYVRAGRIGLKQWADRNHAILSPPPINLPVRPTTNSKGGATITVDPATMGSATGSAWLGYSLNSAAWQGDKFKKEFPAEKIYRHSLREEAEGLRRVLTMANEQNLPDSKLDPSLRLLRLIDGDGMLEC